MRRIRIKQRSTGRQFVQRRTQAVNVRSMVNGIRCRSGLFGRHVTRRPQDRTGQTERHIVDPLGESKIGQPDPAIGIEDQVGRLDVAMNDAAMMRMRQRFGRLQSPSGHLMKRRLRNPIDRLILGQTSTFDELHRIVVDAVFATYGEDGNDVGVMQSGDSFGLALKSLHRLRIGRRAEAQDFQRDPSLQRNLLGFVNNPHATPTDFADNPKVAQLCRQPRGGPGRLMNEFNSRQASFQLRRQIRVIGQQALAVGRFPRLQSRQVILKHIGQPAFRLAVAHRPGDIEFACRGFPIGLCR